VKYKFPRLTLEATQLELESLMRLISIDTEFDDESSKDILYTPCTYQLDMSPSELLRRGFIYEAYDAAKHNFLAIYKKDPRAISQSPKLLNKKNKPRQ
jgi:hypothetical protein